MRGWAAAFVFRAGCNQVSAWAKSIGRPLSSDHAQKVEARDGRMPSEQTSYHFRALALAQRIIADLLPARTGAESLPLPPLVGLLIRTSLKYFPSQFRLRRKLRLVAGARGEEAHGGVDETRKWIAYLAGAGTICRLPPGCA